MNERTIEWTARSMINVVPWGVLSKILGRGLHWAWEKSMEKVDHPYYFALWKKEMLLIVMKVVFGLP